MLEQRYGRFVPHWLRRRLMIVETRIEQELEAFAAELRAGSWVLDAGAGESRHRGLFSHCRYAAADLGVGDAAWDYSQLDVRADLARLPFLDEAFDAALNIVVLEHCPQPAQVVNELARVLRPRGRLLLIAPQLWEVHQAPYDYYRYTRHGLEMLLSGAGLQIVRLEPVGGFFTVLARRALNSMQFFQQGTRLALFPLVAAPALTAGALLPSLDFLDQRRDFTLAYICLAEKRSSGTEPRP